MRAIIIYDDVTRACRACALFQRAAARADKSTRWNLNSWRLDLLELPLLAEEALEEGIEAHLLVIAVAPQLELAPRFLQWLEAWAAHKRVGDAALALFEGDTDGTLSTTHAPALLAFTERHGLSLILGDISPADDTPPHLSQSRVEPELAYSAATMHRPSDPSWEPCQHWGINE